MELFKSKIKDLCVILIFIALLILGTKFDFKFSDSIYSGKNWMNFFIACIAKMPAYSVLMYACVTLFVLALKKESKSEKIVMCFVYALGAVISGMLMFEDMAEVFVDGIAKYAIAAVIGIALIAYLYFFLHDQDQEKLQSFKKEYLVVIVSIAIIVIAVFAIKSIMDRTRFADLLERQGKFTEWYQRGTGGDSMPSGHMALAVALFAAVPVFRKMQLFKKFGYLYYPVIALYALSVGISRVSFGMHVLSDVAVAGIVAFVISKAVTWIFLGFKEDNLEIKEGSILNKL